MHGLESFCLSTNHSQNLWKHLAICDLIDSLLWIFIPLTNHEDEISTQSWLTMFLVWSISVLGEIELFMCAIHSAER